MSIKRKSVCLLLTLLAVVLISATALCFGGDNTCVTRDLSIDETAIAVQTAEPAIELVPVFIGRVDNISGGKTEYLLQDGVEYRGSVSYNFYEYIVRWQEPYGDLDIAYTLTFTDADDGEIDTPYLAGRYTAKVSIVSDVYYIESDKSELVFEIKPKALTIVRTSAPSMVYNGTEYEFTVQAEETITPDPDTYDYVYKQYQDGAWVTMEDGKKPINAGRYKVELIFNNPNYTYNADKFEGEFSIMPRELNVNYVIPLNLQYDGQEKSVVAEVSGWKYNTQLSQTDTGNCELVVICNGVVVSEIKSVGTYKLSMTCDNPNYYIAKQESIEITKKPIAVNYIADNSVVYDGQTHTAQAIMTGIAEDDDVSVDVLYNGSADLPCNAGRYELSCVFYGADRDNYAFVVDQSNAYINIDKAEYAVDDFEIRLYDIKILVIETDFGDIKTVYSIDGVDWQVSNTITAMPMQEYVVRVKLLESENYKEKILSKTVRTGFDAVIFDQMMKDIDLADFSFKDLAAYREVERCLTYVAEGTMEESVDVEYLQSLRKAYSDYKLLANDVVQEACGMSGAISLKYLMGAASLAAASILVIRRKRNEI